MPFIYSGYPFPAYFPTLSHFRKTVSLFSKTPKLLPFAQPLKTSNSFYMPFARRGFLPLLPIVPKSPTLAAL